MKQTAVDWLIEQLIPSIALQQKYIDEIFGQAKEMEKEQIIDAYDAGLFDGSMDDVNDRIYKQYYNEQYRNQ